MGEAVAYRRGDQMEREGDPTRWLAYVTEGCFKYITYGLSERLRVGDRRSGIERAHITWFSFEGEYVGDYPALLRPVGSKRPQGAERLYGCAAQTTIEAMMPSRVLRVTGEQARNFSQSIETMELRALIGEHLLSQYEARYQDLHRTTARERYDLLMQRCPGIVDLLALQDIASFLNVQPTTISKIRRDITFDGR